MRARPAPLGWLLALLAACGSEPTGPAAKPVVASLQLDSVPVTLLTLQEEGLFADVRDQRGVQVLEVPIEWRSADPAVVTVSARGVLTGVGPGAAMVTASVGDASDSLLVTVRTLAFGSVALGRDLACGLAEGETWCWGGPFNDVPHAPRLSSEFALHTIAVHESTVCGIEAGGDRVICFGDNDAGQLGNGSSISGTGFPAGMTGVAALAGGGETSPRTNFFCALLTAGDVHCWGSNQHLALGRADRTLLALPAQVPLPGAAEVIVAGRTHACALLAGRPWCWGSDDKGQLGRDTAYVHPAPDLAVRRPALTDDWQQLAVHHQSSCALNTDGHVYCWGVPTEWWNGDIPAWEPELLDTRVLAVEVASDLGARCVRTGSGAVWCVDRVGRRHLMPRGSPATRIAVSGSSVCAMDAAGDVACWDVATQPTAATPVSLGEPATDIAGSASRVCATLASGTIACWTIDSSPTTGLVDPGTRHVAMGADGVVCIVTASGEVRCGRGASLGLPEPGLPEMASVTVGEVHRCALTADGEAWCWGSNYAGQLGQGSIGGSLAPAPVATALRFVELGAGRQHTCGRSLDGDVYCWGSVERGSLGRGTRLESATPQPIDLAVPLTTLAAAGDRTCGLSTDGAAWCWPLDGVGGTSEQVTGATGLVTLAGGARQFCGLTPDGSLRCWGDNHQGVFGDGTYGYLSPHAVPAGGGLRYRGVSIGGNGAACGVGLDGVTRCWGNTTDGLVVHPDAGAGLITLPLPILGSPPEVP